MEVSVGTLGIFPVMSWVGGFVLFVCKDIGSFHWIVVVVLGKRGSVILLVVGWTSICVFMLWVIFLAGWVRTFQGIRWVW